MAASGRCALRVALTAGQRGDAPAGRALLEGLGKAPRPGPARCMDRAYEGDATRQLARALDFDPVVPPNPDRLQPWAHDLAPYQRRNEVERLIRRPKAFRRVFTRHDKLALTFLGFVLLALVREALR